MDDRGPTSHGFMSQRLRLNYVDWGNAQAPLIVLVHGGRDHARNWDWVARALSTRWHVVAPDLRGHGDSAWSPDGAYSAPFFVSDLAQLIHQLADGKPCVLVGHSLGGAISLRYAGLFPETVRKLVAIEGLGLPLDGIDRPTEEMVERWRPVIADRRARSARQPRRYPSIEDAQERMRAENGFLSAEQARHLTIHGVIRNEDGTYSWKFDNYVRMGSPVDLSADQMRALWRRIDCPVWLVHGADSWADHPDKDGRAACFKDARVDSFERAGHWVHHDRLDGFLAGLDAFLTA
jgi:pimeloyl-ACP methyl ester carboxylesterase